MNKYGSAGRRRKLGRFTMYAGLALPLAAAQAQTQSGDQAVMQQVEVTAEKLGDTAGAYITRESRTATPLSLSARETPQSVTVITQQRIEDQNLQSITDVVNNATGVSVNQYESHRAGFTARGFDIDNLQIDGIPTTWQAQWSGGETQSSLALYDRVEIVRGATGLLTGAGNPSAALNLVRKRANSKVLTGSAEAGIGSWDERRAAADVAMPLNADGTIRARVVGEIKKGDSWLDFGKTDSKTIYATVEADLGANTLLTAGFSRQDDDPKGPTWGGLPYWYTDGTVANWDRSKTTAAEWTHWHTTYNNAFAEVEHNFENGWKVRATYSRGDRKGDSFLLYLSGTPDRTTGAGLFPFTGAYKTGTKQEDAGVHVSGPFTLAGRQHEAAFGYLHMKQDFLSENRAADFGNADESIVDFNNWNGAAYPRPTFGAPTFYESSTTKQDGLYAMARFSITDPLKLIVGARSTNYEKTGVGLYTAEYRIKNDHEVTPYAGLVYEINPTYSAYASYTDIFQPQNLKDFNGDQLEAIVGKSSEIGIKGEFLDKRVNTSLAVFQIKQDNLGQAAGTRLNANGLPETYYRAAKGAKSEGFEAEVSGELVRGLNASAGYSQFRAKDATGVDFNSIYPRKLLRTFVTYKVPGQLAGLTVGGGVNWEGRTYTVDPTAPANTNGLLEQESHALVNLMARYEFNHQLSAQLNVNNAFDKKYFAMFAAYNQITYGAPRGATLVLKYKF
ncbi:outer membrane receptor for ferric coprogen and ferric-rhodotorulic acid [Pseudoduganella lurida]|uniref:Outer membrane receptor for ferric coprogen and ferric-rhodotorulic acid n=1 Tax=Pseudoduganella lurida TaxID=1036180 RepID=A0A562RFL3_9BURK|nr:TonB-dependent siderophore receptor [Pseudoduganella lurida]TWI67364.1 outer membrane receptor for ferric coprogen and ferric-rhodotorulic acid [Pseudoduganella lurida]